MICFYHSRDLDGWCSGAIVKLKYPDCELIGYDYGQPFPWDKVVDQEVIMADVSLQPFSEMLTLANSCKKFTWIDHHKGAIDDYFKAVIDRPGFYTNISGSLLTGIAACELTWKHLFPDQHIPPVVEFLGIWDTFRKTEVTENDWNEVILPVQYGMRVICNSPETFPVDLLQPTSKNDPTGKYDTIIMGVQQKLIDILESGKSVLKYQSQVDEYTAKKAFVVNWEGYRIIAINGIQFNSLTFKSIWNPEKHDIMMMFQFEGQTKTWKFSIYTEKEGIDCSAIAKRHGGGGHIKAAGFQLTINEFEDFFNDYVY